MTRERGAYAGAGVDVDAGDRAVELLRAHVGRTLGEVELIGGLGGFAGAVALPTGMREPVLVSATDGVGTKTAIASAMRRFGTIGRDLVAMCADDVVCLGARPLLFLDYLAVGRVDPVDVAELVGGVATGCQLAGCALVGGETAEHPGLMRPDEFDVAGFCVGIAERADLLDGATSERGDVIVGLAASGLHANGYSLVRALLASFDLALDRPYLEVVSTTLGEHAADQVLSQEPDHVMATLGEVLLTPTRIYARDVLALRQRLAVEGTPLRGLAHVTGGGLPGNVPRALPPALGARLDPATWPLPSIHRLVAGLAGMDGLELRATLNGGLGMVAVVPPAGVASTLDLLEERGVPAWVVGEVVTVETLDGARYAERSGPTRSQLG
ncbi:MAG: phosphoribosylformylglycinamidine cyclo-ligase [Candidatus Limnocylindrales bacterium]